MNYISSNLCFLLISLVWCVCCTKEATLDDQCPPWFSYNTTTKACECFSSPSTDQIVKCTKKEALLRLGYCMTYEEGSGFYVGLCDNVRINGLNTTEDNYIRLPRNVSDLNDYMCRPMNRKGRMCSQCDDGFGLAAFSVGYACTNCTGVWYGVPLYLVLEFVPITIFYFIVMFFHINLTSAPMVAFVLYSQAVVSFISFTKNKLIFHTTLTYRFISIMVSFYGIWNLDFFRFIIPPFCVSSLLKPIHIDFLYFISVFYPLFLIAITRICIHLYSRNFKPAVWLWKKLKQNVYNRLNVNWDATTTIVDVFATFFLLSYAKLVFTSLLTLSYRISMNVYNQSLMQTLHVTSDPSVKFFGKEHLPFAIISIFIFLLAVLPIPLLLALYPIRFIRTLLFECPIGNRTITAINIFVQKFYSCYRDSTDGGRDMRILVCFYFFLRVLLHLLGMIFYQIPLNVAYSILVFIYIACTILITLAQPYKRTYMNNTDALILANLAILCVILSQVNGDLPNNGTQFFYLLSGSIFGSLPLIGLIGVLVYMIIRKVTKLPCCKKLPHSYDQEGFNMQDYDQLILECHDATDHQEHTVRVQESDEH